MSDTKLKTLKEITIVSEKYNVYCYAEMIKEIKAEAVKWVKEIKKDRTIGIEPNLNYKKKGDPLGTCVYGTEERKIINMEKIELLMEFFNLTQEDLKDD
jgi:hypothetical protein